VQFENARYPISVTDSGIIMEHKPMQFSKAKHPIVFNDDEKTIDDNPLYCENASIPIEEIVSGSA
jgi:hypothetical protein